MKINTKKFLVREKEMVKLSKWPTNVAPFYKSKEQYNQLLSGHVEELRSLQNLLYASNRYSLLLIFQSMDAAGKDSSIKHVMSGINPQGCQVYSFKHPSAKELEHDFLWRTSVCLPERGKIGIFNRSYYEEVLIVRVHPEILQGEGLYNYNKKTIWKNRYNSILNLESHLHQNGTRIIKFFLHVSKNEQKKRFLKRIDDPQKNWKISLADIEERKFWNKYMKAYESCLNSTSTTKSPWYVIPADDKNNTHLIISQIILDTLKDLKMKYPHSNNKRKKELQLFRKLLTK